MCGYNKVTLWALIMSGLDTLTFVTSQCNLSLQKAINSDDSYERVNLAGEVLKGNPVLDISTVAKLEWTFFSTWYVVVP